MANCEPPSKPARGVAERADLAAFGRVTRLDRNETKCMADMKKSDDHFRFDFEMIGGEREAIPCGQIDHAESALRIGNGHAAVPPDPSTHPLIYKSANPRHCACVAHAVSDEQFGLRCFDRTQEFRDIRGCVLAVAIHSQGPGKSMLRCGF